ncbi:MAG TPA: DUF1194 domain-containing protein [Dongiaceae bacterium]|nr:DUF1194 domain-containing protein [Dongiaceae bacterium]
MRRNAVSLVFAAGLVAAAVPSATRAADTAVDLELILAVDVSRSMDPDEQKLQRGGYVAAITNPDLIAAITHGPHKKIALSYVEWSGPELQNTVVDWRVIDGPAAAAAFADALARAPLQTYRGTSISGGLVFAKAHFDGSGFDAPRRVIDVSGDGPNNMGVPIELAREAVVSAGITINGLPIMIERSDFLSIDNLDAYYQDCVIGGPGAFTIAVHSADQFEEAIRRKLVLEIAGRAPPSLLVPAADTRRVDCLVGEKLRQRWMSE